MVDANTTNLLSNKALQSFQLIRSKLTVTIDLNTKAGNANFDKNKLMPLNSDVVSQPNRPAIYPINIIPKHSTNVGNILVGIVFKFFFWCFLLEIYSSNLFDKLLRNNSN